MEAFFPKLLDDFTGTAFLRTICGKYHYEETQLRVLRSVAEEMLSLMRREAFWEVRAPWEWECEEKKDAVYEGVLMTLGRGVDRLQESYHDRELLTESYMLEVMAGELLLQGYQAYNSQVRDGGKLHVARYHFPGSEESLPLKTLPVMLSRFSGQVSCNEAFCMLPRKSVVFLAELTGDEAVKCEGICLGCGSVHCPNRMEESNRTKSMQPDIPLTYGYRIIMGKW